MNRVRCADDVNVASLTVSQLFVTDEATERGHSIPSKQICGVCQNYNVCKMLPV